MTQEVEIEFKNLLTKKEFNDIYTSLPFPSEGITQTNYYFETQDFLLQANQSALRIREKDGEFQLTLKEPLEVGLLETHDSLTKRQAEQWIQGHPILLSNTGQQLKNMGVSINDLTYYGKLTTKRFECQKDGLTFVLDESFYNDYVDFELEIEAPSEEEGQQAFQQLLTTHDIPNRRTPNKIERFFSTLTRK